MSNSVAVQEVGFRDVMNTLFGGIISIVTLVPNSVRVVATNLDSVQRISNAGNMLASRVETRATYDHEIEMLKLTAKIAAKKASLAAEASA